MTTSSPNIISSTPLDIVAGYSPAVMTIAATLTSTSAVSYAKLGDVISYTYAFTFPFAVSALVITDSNSSLNFALTSATVAGSSTTLGTFTYTVVAADLLKKSLTLPVLSVAGNIVATADIAAIAISASGIDIIGANITTSTPFSVVFTCPIVNNTATSSLTMTATAVLQDSLGNVISTNLYSASAISNTTNSYSIGNQIVYTITNSVTSYNSITATITSNPTIAGFVTTPFVVTAGNPVVHTVTVPVTQAMIDSGQYVNIFTVAGTSTDPTTGIATTAPISGSASVSFTAVAAQVAVLNIAGSFTPTKFSFVGQTIRYTITASIPASNNVAFSKVQIFQQGSTTPLVTSPTSATFALGKAASTTFAYTYHTTYADVKNGNVDLVFVAKNTNAASTVSSNSLPLDVTLSHSLFNFINVAKVDKIDKVDKVATRPLFHPSTHLYTGLATSLVPTPLISFKK